MLRWASYQPFTGQSASPLPASWASMGSWDPPNSPAAPVLLEGSTCPVASRACAPREREPPQDLSIHTAGTSCRGCCSTPTAQGTLDTAPWHRLHPQTWHVQPAEWGVFPSAPAGCDPCCPSHGSWLGKTLVQCLSLARGAPTCAQDRGQARRHREDLAVQSPVEGFHCLVTDLAAATLHMPPRRAALQEPLGSPEHTQAGASVAPLKVPNTRAGRCSSLATTAAMAERPRHRGWAGDRLRWGSAGPGLQPCVPTGGPVALNKAACDPRTASAGPSRGAGTALNPRPAALRPGGSCRAPGWGRFWGRAPWAGQGRDPSLAPSCAASPWRRGTAASAPPERVTCPVGGTGRAHSRAHVTGTRESGLQLPACRAPPHPRSARREALCRSFPLPRARPKHGGSCVPLWPRPLLIHRRAGVTLCPRRRERGGVGASDWRRWLPFRAGLGAGAARRKAEAEDGGGCGRAAGGGGAAVGGGRAVPGARRAHGWQQRAPEAGALADEAVSG